VVNKLDGLVRAVLPWDWSQVSAKHPSELRPGKPVEPPWESEIHLVRELRKACDCGAFEVVVVASGYELTVISRRDRVRTLMCGKSRSPDSCEHPPSLPGPCVQNRDITCQRSATTCVTVISP
jgi:hypothetical protein